MTCPIAPDESSESNSPGNSSNLSQSGTPVNLDVTLRKGKRKITQDSIEQIGNLVEKMIKLQVDSEKNHLKLEEKLLEMEERRHRESHGMMMHMMAFMCPPTYS